MRLIKHLFLMKLSFSNMSVKKVLLHCIFFNRNGFKGNNGRLLYLYAEKGSALKGKNFLPQGEDSFLLAGLGGSVGYMFCGI